jgi:hypothetical protein
MVICGGLWTMQMTFFLKKKVYFPAEKVRRKFAIAAAFCAFLWAFGRRNLQIPVFL